MPSYFDAHTHVQFAAFKDDWRSVIERALAADVWLVNVGTQRDTSRRAIEIAGTFPKGVFATVGLHPIHTGTEAYTAGDLDASQDPAEVTTIAAESAFSFKGFKARGETFDFNDYRKLAEHPKVLAIGECGLDYHRLGEYTKSKQRAAFEQQIELANLVKKPLMIHCRDAFDDLINVLRDNVNRLASPHPGIVHFFTGNRGHAAALADLGFCFSFGGVITFTRDYDDAIRMLPPDRLLSETDAPYVAPAPLRGRRNEPANVVHVIDKLAELRGISTEVMRAQILANAARIFAGLNPEFSIF